MTDLQASGLKPTVECYNQEVSEEEEPQQPALDNKVWSKKSIFRSWLLLCFATGPVASMSRTYVPAVIQSVARLAGRTKDGQTCDTRGNDCYVKFGIGTVHYSSYVLYLKAIFTALEGVLAIFIMGIADYGHYRKWILIGSISLYGILALPFAGLTGKNYSTLRGLSALYALLNILDSAYQILEGSYIPLFMRAAVMDEDNTTKQDRTNIELKRGSVVSAMGLFLGNCGGIAALLIGIIISYTRGGPTVDGYHNFLLAISVAASITIVFSVISACFIPDVEGKKRPKGQSLVVLTIRRFLTLLRDIQKYPHAFLYCVSWVIWNVTFNNFMSVFVLLFRSTLGLGSSDSEYTIYTFMSYICASMGSLLWMALYGKCKFNIKIWGYIFLGVSLFTNFWGSLGINHQVKIGFKHRWEFWVFEVLYSSTSSAQRSLNRTIYSTLLPAGEEAQFFGLEVMLGIATGWIGSLVNASIQDLTGNDRFPFMPNTILVAAALVLYYFTDIEKGVNEVKKKFPDKPKEREQLLQKNMRKNTSFA